METFQTSNFETLGSTPRSPTTFLKFLRRLIMAVKVYVVSLEALKPYIVANGSTEDYPFVDFNLFGINTRLATKNILPHSKVYIYVTYKFEQPVRVEITKTERFEYSSIEQSDLFDDLKERNQLKENSMFDNFKISEVKLKKEIHGIALKVAVESLISTGCLGDAKIEMENDKPFLVKDGDVEELTGAGFIEKAEKFLIGKTKDELTKIASSANRKGYIMCHLINGLNLIESYTAERCQSSILS